MPSIAKVSILQSPGSPSCKQIKMASPTSTWQDRRFMWQKGKTLHEPSRRMSQSGDKSVADAVQQAAAAASPFSISKPNNSENPFIKKAATSPVATLPSPPLRDRHFIWSKGKEVHESSRRPSMPGDKSSDASMSTADRRRVSTRLLFE